MPEKPLRIVVGKALLISGIATVLHLFATWWSVAPHGSDILLRYYISWTFIVVLLLTAVYNGLILFFCAIGRLFGIGKRTWAQLGYTAVFCVIVFVVTTLAVSGGMIIRQAGFQAIADRGEPLIAAIKHYQAEQGEPPATLDALVPHYLPSIPGTGVAAYPYYVFTTNSSPTRYGGNPWILSVDVSTDNLTRDQVLYYPNGKYPSRPRVAEVTRLGDWALVEVANDSDSK